MESGIPVYGAGALSNNTDAVAEVRAGQEGEEDECMCNGG